MLVKLVHSLDNVDEIHVNATSVKEILNYLKFLRGEEVTNKIISGHYKYILVDSTDNLDPVGLMPEVLLSEIEGYDTLWIIAETSGSDGGLIVTLVAGSAFAATTTGLVVAAVINIVISIAFSAVMSLLSPTPEFSSDPSQAQNKQSSLFNGAPLIREQGGSMPLIFGDTFAGGVLISSGVSTEDII